MLNQQGKLFLILGPSGSGKGVLINELKSKHAEFFYPISVTSRQPRENEKNGQVYFFVTKDEFEKKIDAGDFLEWAVVHQDNYYGTLKKPIFEALEQKKVVIREIDVQGYEQISEMLPKEKLVSIFILPDSIENLVERIKKRSKISDEEVTRRVESAKREIEKSDECDYVIYNSDGHLKEAVENVEQIILKETKPKL